MRWTSLLAIYVLFWAFSLFLVLPFGVRTAAEAGTDHVPGQADSAPHEFSFARVARRATVVATVAYALFLANYQFGWITTDRILAIAGK